MIIFLLKYSLQIGCDKKFYLLAKEQPTTTVIARITMPSIVDNFHRLQDWHGFLQQCESSQASFVAQQDLAAEHCRQRESILTKPGGSLGRLEDLTSWFYRTRGVYDNLSPEKLLAHVLVFAGNHGVAENQVSAFPPIVTAAMVKNFVDGGAAINQLAQYAHASLQVVSMNDLAPTKNFANPEEPTPAMTEQECCDAMKLGFQSVDKNSHVVVLGEMGIANSTAAAAICHALYGGEVESWVGRGTGIDDAMLGNKQQAVKHGVAQYKKYRAAQATNPDQIVGQGLGALEFLGGFEMAGMAGAMVAGLYHHIPIILDSYVTVASLACLAQHV